MTKVIMINDVTPHEYNLKGQYGWADSLQWEAGAVYDLDETLASNMVFNGDAIYKEETPTDIFLQGLAPPTKEQLARILRPVNQNPQTYKDVKRDL